MIMSTQVTVTLPDDVYEGIERLAENSGRDVNDVLANTLTISLSLLLEQPNAQDLEALSDTEVLALVDGRMEESLSKRMSQLLQKNQNGELDEIEQHELSLFMYVYHQGSLRKVQAMEEAIRRGLRSAPKL
jgi:hypothetical protein